jgi:hypothetical protein
MFLFVLIVCWKEALVFVEMAGFFGLFVIEISLL